MTKPDLLRLLDDVQEQIIKVNPPDEELVELLAKLSFIGLEVRKGEIKDLTQLVSHILYVSIVKIRGNQ